MGGLERAPQTPHSLVTARPSRAAPRSRSRSRGLAPPPTPSFARHGPAGPGRFLIARPPGASSRPPSRSGGANARITGMAVQALFAIQNGFLGIQRSALFYGDYSEAKVQIPVTCYVARTSDAVVLFDTGVSPRAVPGLLRHDALARFTEADLLVHRLDALRLRPENVDLVVISHLHYDHAGGAE